ncbi:phosphoribosyl-AMP cyclohydrolase [Ktedonosporobacter rubrisoli]|uniref:Histidine biosynthesis bifunctional protein HisIE n=1 Tax=Ktedonosporobacter rubrisoli TaxID=2509675 RepID=A0A4P6K4E0_KTERU|nr:phosphoribosyl-AMP cyclohydrolase [Ktedonosporobacter rubrisoli]QBD83178.1 phosphoribosyl-AMP cyclohydrolase [Ktedonosporobacter rubrisoli]
MLRFDRQELIPAVIQDDETGEVLMVAFMNEEALRLTRETGHTHFFSRSRQTIWHKGEQSGNVQEVRGIFINCEENSLLVRVIQHGGAACHDGYRSCYYRRLLPDDTYQVVAQRVFDPKVVYAKHSDGEASPQEPTKAMDATSIPVEIQQKLEAEMRQLYGVYLYLRDHDLSEISNTSRLLQEHSQSYLVSRLGDELQELADVQSGEHIHSGRQPDTVLEGSQVGYWLFLLAAGKNVPYNEFAPHEALLKGFCANYDNGKTIELRQECLSLLSSEQVDTVARGLQLGFALIGWACSEAKISPLDPAEFDLEQMRRKGLVK